MVTTYFHSLRGPRVPAGYVIARPHPRTSTVTIEITPDVDRFREALKRATRLIAPRNTRPEDA